MKITHSRVKLTSSDLTAVKSILSSGMIAQGKNVTAFETQIAKYHGLKYAVAVNSGTSAIHLALLSLNIKAGDEVIIPSYTCSALLNPIKYVGASPVLVDIDPYTLNICPIHTKSHITSKTKAIIVPHMFGRTANIKAIIKLGIPVIEDCAQAIGANIEGRKVGTFGHISVFSFYATKVITTGEGGMICSNDRKIIKKIHDLREYDDKEDTVTRFNYKMTDFQAALGISQLKQLNANIKHRRAIAKIFDQAVQNKEFIPKNDPGQIYFRYILKIPESIKQNFMEQMQKNGITCRNPIFKPLHKYLPGFYCPHTERLARTAISIPIYSNLNSAEISFIKKHLHHLTF
ncbi:MAG: DegT/DnrJ/EryC1/StrS family aminotransferase [Candidatus Omnitrophica bacterium]|nr:DegT/DnrJ/EryC1/StrS family aminotransferase [Candidatus Omnitrophota bacterium]